LLISPLNSVPKQTIEDRRVILDLSSVTKCAVNDYVPKDSYLGDPVSLVFPKIDDFVKLVLAKGKGALMYKKDLSRAYRQISICPSNYNLVAYVWQKHVFCDTVLTMGCRSSAQICQRVTNAIAYMMFRMGIPILNYLDDLAGAENSKDAWFAYNTLAVLLQKCGIEESIKKSNPPSQIMTFLGILFNSNDLTELLMKGWLKLGT
jgi:hypothetical protein